MKYAVKVEFETDKSLSRAELINMLCAVELQVQEPMDDAGNEEGYTTKNITSQMEIHLESGIHILK